jgi:formate hydrogenlyase subunit 3/multisubunit Na+/H+ antiporter MnhD subunit
MIGTLGFCATLILTVVNIYAKYKQDCSMHVKVMGQKIIDMTLDSLTITFIFEIGIWGLCVTEFNIHVKYCTMCVKVMVRTDTRTNTHT